MNATIVQAAKAGDKAALDSLFTDAVAKARKVAYRMLLPRHVANVEDVVQDAALSAFAHLQDFKGDAEFGTWFHKIVVNHVLMYLRKQKGRGIVVDPAVLDEVPASREYCADAIFAQMALRQKIEDALCTTTAIRRRMFNAYAKQGYTTRELAVQYDVPVATVKSTVFRARRDLQAALTQ